MNFLHRLGNRLDLLRFQYSLKPQELKEIRSLLDDAKTGSGIFAPGYFGNTSGENLSPAQAMRISTWFTCLQVRWDAVGMLPFNVFKTDGASKHIATDHPTYKLLHTRPNPRMTATQFWKIVQMRRDNWGNCFCPIFRDPRGNIVAIDIITDDNTSKGQVKVYYSSTSGELYYEWHGHMIPSADMLHFKGFTTDGKSGLSLTEYHMETIGRLRAIQKFSNRSISRNPGVYASSDKAMPMSEAQKKAFKEYWDKEVTGYGEDGYIAVLYDGFKLNNVGINPKDALYLEQTQATKEDIYGITKVPPTLAQNYNQSGQTYSTVESQALNFLIWGLAVNLKDIEEECNYKLFTDKEQATMFCKFNEKAVLRLDAKTQSEIMDRNFKNGTASINENREILDLNPIENGDDHYVELNNLGPVRLQDEIIKARVTPKPGKPQGSSLPVNGNGQHA